MLSSEVSTVMSAADSYLGRRCSISSAMAEMFFLPWSRGRSSLSFTRSRMTSGRALRSTMVPLRRMAATFSSRSGTPPPQETILGSVWRKLSSSAVSQARK